MALSLGGLSGLGKDNTRAGSADDGSNCFWLLLIVRGKSVGLSFPRSEDLFSLRSLSTEIPSTARQLVCKCSFGRQTGTLYEKQRQSKCSQATVEPNLG